MSNQDHPLDGCHCCEGQPGPAQIHNAPGLSELAWRIDTQPGFYQRMLTRLPLWRLPGTTADAPRPLAALRTRASDDAAVALVDASACVADLLTFYQERFANEGFLRTATERRSVLELARAVGYELRPGVAASVHLVFTVEDAPGAPGLCTIAAGAPVQSVPPQGKLPQVFETGETFVARAQWNALRARQTRPADMAVLEVAGAGRLVVLYPEGSLPSDTAGLHRALSSGSLYRLDPGLAVDPTVDAVEVARVYLAEEASGAQAGELLLFVGKNGVQLRHLVLRALAVEDEPARRRVRIDLEPLPDPLTPAAPPPAHWAVPITSFAFGSYAQAQIEGVPFTGSAIGKTIANQSWKENELQAMIAIQGWSSHQLVAAVAVGAKAPARPVAPEAGTFRFAQRLGFFGHNAPKWSSLPASNLKGNAYPAPWDQGERTGTEAAPVLLASSRTIWTDSQGAAITPHAYLERPVPTLAPGSWMVFDSPGAKATTYALFDAREVARADFAVSGRAMALRLADSNGQPLSGTPAEDFRFRDTTAHVASRRQPMAELPIESPVAAGSKRVELSTMVLGLVRGQPLAFVGARHDVPGVEAAEIALIDEVVHGAGRSLLVLQQPLTYSYRREALQIHANVVRATHGQSFQEVLGSGDAKAPFQRFTLARPPTTHLSAASAAGVNSTLELRVNGLLWTERPSLYGAAPDDHVYATRIDNEARMEVLFGDGHSGARLPSGQMNVQARYRSGIGPDGEVAAGTLTMLRAMPLGLRSVGNPLPASGAQGPEQLEDARRNAPLTLLAFERVVSLSDYEDFARAFPGIGKARADLAWAHGTARVLLSVAGTTGGVPGAEILANLGKAITDLSDASQAFVVRACVLRYFRCTAHVAIDARYEVDAVLSACRTKLQLAFGFQARDLAQPVTASELLALLHQVPGVLAVDLDALQPYGEAASSAGAAQVVAAFGARWDAAAREMKPAELMLLNPAALELLEALR